MTTLFPGDMSPLVLRIQARLRIKESGTYDDATRQRVRGLQVVHGLALQDGVADEEVLAIIFPEGVGS